MYRNVNKAPLILPDGKAIADGETVELSEDALACPGVQVWIEERLLLDPDAEAEAALVASEGSDDEPVDLDAMDENQLRAYATENDIEVDGRWGRDKLIEAIQAFEGND